MVQWNESETAIGYGKVHRDLGKEVVIAAMFMGGKTYDPALPLVVIDTKRLSPKP